MSTVTSQLIPPVTDRNLQCKVQQMFTVCCSQLKIFFRPNETCADITKWSGMTADQLESLNPGLNCKEIVERGLTYADVGRIGAVPFKERTGICMRRTTILSNDLN